MSININKYFHYLNRVLLWAIILLTAGICFAQEPEDNQFINLSIEELNNLDVTSVTGVEEQWFRAPAAIYVITQEDIQRTGHQTLADLLRLVPGIDIAQASSNTWSIGARGIKGNYGDSLLMLIDGRSVHDPLQSFIRWDTQDMVLNDIKNIEVIRGPGATLWGSKAVNGVINVTTKSAKDTQGWYFSGITGTHERANFSLRYGDQIGQNTAFRVWSKYTNRSAFKTPDGSDHHDDWDLYTTGFRIDTDAPNNLTWSLQGGVAFSDQLGGLVNQAIPNTHLGFNNIITDGRVQGAYLQTTISQQINDHNKWTILGSYEHNTRSTLSHLGTERNTFDLDYRHRLATSDNQLFVWGAALRISADDTQASATVAFDPQSDLTHDQSFFIQSSTKLFDDKISLVLGSKFEHNDFSGFEYHPSIRMTWLPNQDNTIWAAVSRAVRSPVRSNTDTIITPFYVDPGLLAGGGPVGAFPVTVSGTRDLKSEKLISYEMGYRTHLTKDLTLDAAGYFNDYSELISISDQFKINNNLGGNVFGCELNAVWTPAPSLRVEAGYSYARSFLQGDLSELLETGYPENHFHLRTYLDIGNSLEWNGALYFVDENKTYNADAYVRLDTGLTWRIDSHASLSLWGKNLLDNQHSELYDPTQKNVAAEVPRSFMLQLKMTF